MVQAWVWIALCNLMFVIQSSSSSGRHREEGYYRKADANESEVGGYFGRADVEVLDKGIDELVGMKATPPPTTPPTTTTTTTITSKTTSTTTTTTTTITNTTTSPTTITTTTTSATTTTSTTITTTTTTSTT